jgi:hypothetical protein
MQAASRVVKLEKKVDAMSKALDLLLFEEPECLTEEEAKALKETMDDYLRGKKENFVPLDEL